MNRQDSNAARSSLPSSDRRRGEEESPEKVEVEVAGSPSVSAAEESAAAKAVDSTGSSSDRSPGANDVKEELYLDAKPSAKPAASKNCSLVEMPTDHDVLFGRGRPYQSHPGNVNLHRLVALHKDRYERSRRFDKLAIADQIVYEVKAGKNQTRGRFLRRVEGKDYWEEAPDEVSREKVAHALRGQIKQARETRRRNPSALTGTALSGLQESKDAPAIASAVGLATTPFIPARNAAGSQSALTRSPSRSDYLASLLQQQQSNVDILRQAIASGTSSRVASILVSQQQQQEQQQLVQLSNGSAMHQALAGTPSSNLSIDSLLRILAAQQQERQMQEQLMILQMAQWQSNETNAIASLRGSNRGSLALPNIQLRDHLLLDNAFALYQQQQQQQQQRNAYVNPSLPPSLLASAAGGVALNRTAMAASQLENAQINAAIERMLRDQQSTRGGSEANDGRGDPSSRTGPP